MSLPLWEAKKILTAASVFNGERVEEAKRVVEEAEVKELEAGTEGDPVMPPAPEPEVVEPDVELPEVP